MTRFVHRVMPWDFLNGAVAPSFADATGGMQVAVHASLAAEALRAHALVAEVRARVLPEEHFWHAWAHAHAPERIHAARLMACAGGDTLCCGWESRDEDRIAQPFCV